jgi:cardiolipin synthase
MHQVAAIHNTVAPVDIDVAGNSLRLFSESPPLMEAMVEDLRTAQRRAWVESYTFADDAAGRAIAEALKERAAAGVDCRLMYDAVGSFDSPRALFDDLAAAGVQVHAFCTLSTALWKFASLRMFNRRNHRKITIVDDHVAYFGGMNIIDQSGIETIEDAKARDLPASAGWRDVHVRLTGPAQTEVADAFDRLWQRVHHHRRRPWPRWQVNKMLSAQEDSIFFFDSRPRLHIRRPARVLVPLLRRARHTITLSMAYFIPVGDVLKELLRARRRGVTVRVIVPGVSDVPVVQWASRHMYERLLRRGIRIYERKDQMLHSKVMVIDGQWSVIGSCNLDPRSMRLNLEFLAVIRSAELASAVTAICVHEQRHSRPVNVSDCHRRSRWQRMLDSVAWSLRRWL